MNQFIDSPQQSPMAYQPYMPFQGTNNLFANMALQYLVPGMNPGYNGSVYSPYNSFGEAASAKKESDRFMDAVNNRSEAERRIQMATADSAMRRLMERSGQVYTAQHQAGVQAAMGMASSVVGAFGGYSQQFRMLNDIAAGGADPMNSRLAFEMSHKRMRDVTGADRMSRGTADTMGTYLHDELFGDRAKAGKGVANFWAAELPEMLREMADRGKLDTGAQGDFLASNKSVLRDLANGRLSKASEEQFRDTARRAGIADDLIDKVRQDPSILENSAKLDTLAARSTAAKVANVARDFDGLRNAVKSLVDPNNQKSITEAFKSFEMFSAAYGSQFTHKDQARIVREATSGLKEMGLGYDAFAALTERGHGMAQQMGFQGAAEMTMLPSVIASMTGASKRGKFSGELGYGALTRSEYADREMSLSLQASGSQNSAFLHGIMSMGVEAFDENTEEGRRMIAAIKEFEATGDFTDEDLMNMSGSQKKSMVRKGFKDSASMGLFSEAMADRKGIEATMNTKGKAAAEHIRELQPLERLKKISRDANRMLAATEVGKNLKAMGIDPGQMIADTMAEGGFSNEAKTDPTIFKREMAEKQLRKLTDEQIAMMGGEDAARSQLIQMNTAAQPAINKQRDSNANMDTFLEQVGPERRSAKIQAEARQKIDAMVNSNTEGILNRSPMDVLRKGVREFVSQMQDGTKTAEDFDYKAVLATALATAGPDDKESLKSLESKFTEMDKAMLKEQAVLDSSTSTQGQKDKARAMLESYEQKKRDTFFKMVGYQSEEQKAEEERKKKEEEEQGKQGSTGSGAAGAGAGTNGQVTLTGQPIINHLEIHVPNGTFTMDDAKAGPAIQRA